MCKVSMVERHSLQGRAGRTSLPIRSSGHFRPSMLVLPSFTLSRYGASTQRACLLAPEDTRLRLEAPISSVNTMAQARFRRKLVCGLALSTLAIAPASFANGRFPRAQRLLEDPR